MLYVYYDKNEITDLEIAKDPVILFNRQGLEDTPIVRLILDKIEQAKYLDAQHFLSRYNEKLPIEFLSTGTKAAIVAGRFNDIVIDLRECGVNARDVIFNYIDNAHVLAYSRGYGSTIDNLEYKEFWCNGYTFNSMEKFADYIYRDYPNEPTWE